jgi:beta-glucosidase
MKNQKRDMTPRRLTAWVTCLLISGLLSTGVTATQAAEQPEAQQALPETTVKPQEGPPEIVVFDGNNVAPWRMYLGSSTNWMIPIEGPETKSYKSNIVSVRTTGYMKSTDAYQAEWKGGLGQVYWQEFQSWDLTELAAQGGALSMVIRIDKEPKKSVELKMDCGYPCAGSLNMTQLFKTVPKDQWFRVSFKIDCFKEAGANLAHIMAPLVVATKGSFKMSFADVRLMTNPPPESVIACG